MWLSAKRWAIILKSIDANNTANFLLMRKVDKLMSATDDLKTAIDTVQTAVDANTATVTEAVTDINTLIAEVANGTPGISEADAAAFITRLQTIGGNLTTSTSALAAAAAQVPNPPPAPAPTDGSAA